MKEAVLEQCILKYHSETGLQTSRKLFSKATRMLVSMLVRFFLLRFKPSTPSPGEFRALGLERVESDERFSEKESIKVTVSKIL